MTVVYIAQLRLVERLVLPKYHLVFQNPSSPPPQRD